MENSPTSTSDSWLFVKEDEIGKHPEEEKSSSLSSEELEDSDGISIISESEMYKNHLNHSDNDETPIIKEEEEEDDDDDDEVKDAINLPLTPPVTPNSNNNYKDEKIGAIEYKRDEEISKELEIHQHQEEDEVPSNGIKSKTATSHGAVLLIGMALIIALLYTNISSLKKEFASTTSMYEQRIARLEKENQVLKAQLNELIKQLRESQQQVKEDEPMRAVNEKLLEARFIERQEEAIQKPITKDVWMGGEKEDVVKILDKKYNSLPDYCYFTDESDLFYEYNKENCERKKRKLERRVKKFHQKNDQKAESIDDDIYKPPIDSSYDNFMSQTTEELLKSLNDEIQEIKSSRISYSITDNDENDDMPYSTNDELIIEKHITTDDKKKIEKSKSKQKRGFNGYENQENNNTQDESKKKKKKKSKKQSQQQQGNVNEWHDQRTAAREKARKQNIDDGEENWFIKRKNDREIHRLEQSIHN